MSEVKRYDHWVAHANSDDPESYMGESQDGDWIRHSDYAALQQKLDAVLAENVVLKCGAEYFMYSPDCGFERYRSHAEAINAANEMIDDYRADAHDGWCDEVEGVCVGVILKYAQQCEEQKPSEENGFLGSVNYVMPEEQTPATDAILNEVRAEHPDARRMDWLVSKCVEVRQPLRYGSSAMFRSHAITDEEDEHYATKLREQIDNAILSEGATK